MTLMDGLSIGSGASLVLAEALHLWLAVKLHRKGKAWRVWAISSILLFLYGGLAMAGH